MFYIWHTIIIATFMAVAYYLGYQYGRKKASRPNMHKV